MDSDQTTQDGAGQGDGAAVVASPPVPRATYFDGTSNRKHSVELRFADGLDILEDGTGIASWPYDAVRRADGPADVLRLRAVTALPLARLEVQDTATKDEIAARCKSLDLGRASPGETWRIVGWSLAAVTSIVLLAAFGIPILAERVAPFVPARIEARIGQAVDRQARTMFGGQVCAEREGHAALTSLVDKLSRAGGVSVPFDAQVLSSPIPNAFALPGGKIYVLDGLLQNARSVDEVAGVLAHEIGHVHHHDNMRRIIQAGGTSFLAGLLFGDVTGGSAVIFVGRSLFDASYSRDAERDADAFAGQVMRKLGRSPKPLGEFLLRMTGRDANRSMSLFSSHPLSEERLARLSADASPATGPEILSEAEWRALKAICGGNRPRAIPKPLRL